MAGSIQGNEQEICPAARRAMELFRQHRPELEEKLHSGALRYAVEWWEQDEYWLDENAHLLFLFADGGEMDIVLHRDIWDELAGLLKQQGVPWEYQYRNAFGSNILYPPAYAGQPYYEKVTLTWWQRLFDWNEHWVRRKDLPMP